MSKDQNKEIGLDSTKIDNTFPLVATLSHDREEDHRVAAEVYNETIEAQTIEAHNEALEILLSQAEAYEREFYYEEATETYNKVAEILICKAKACDRQNDYQGASKNYNKAAEILICKAEICDRANYQEAGETYNKAAELLLSRAEVYKRKGDYHEATRSYDKAAEILICEAKFCERRGEYDEATESYDKALEILSSKAEAYEREDDYHEAAGIYNKVAEILLSQAWVYNLLEVEYLNQIEDLTSHYKHFNLAHHNSANAGKSKAIELKSRAYNEAAKSYVNGGNALSAEAYLKAAKVLYNSTDYMQSISMCDQVIKLKPKSANAYYYKCDSYFGLVQPKEAVKAYAEAKKLNINDDKCCNKGHEAISLYSILTENVNVEEINLIHEIMSYLINGYEPQTETLVTGEVCEAIIHC